MKFSSFLYSMKRTSIFVIALSLSGCINIMNGPINTHTAKVDNSSSEFLSNKKGSDESLIMGISFSGGGTRAASFGYGVVREIETIKRKNNGAWRSTLDDIRIISGVSGGSIIGTYLAYKGNQYHDFKERFLFKNAEEELYLNFSPLNFLRFYKGAGVNDLTTLSKWMNINLFNGATFADIRRQNGTDLWVTATDILQESPFIFNQDTFSALCSDLDTVPLAQAVATSCAVPVVFAPIAISTGSSLKCNYIKPAWIDSAINNREAPLSLKAVANALASYRNNKKIKYIKLLDGGLADDLSVSGFFTKRAAANTPHGPLSKEQAIKFRTFLYIVVDSGRKTTLSLGQSLSKIMLNDIAKAATETTVRSSEQRAFDALSLQTAQWKEEMIKFRCSLPKETIIKHRGTIEGWNCKDIEMNVERISFDDFSPEISAKLNNIPTRLNLPKQSVELLIASGREAIRKNKKIQEMIKRQGAKKE